MAPLERDRLGKLVRSAAVLRLFMVTDRSEDSVQAVVPPTEKSTFASGEAHRTRN